MADKAPNRWEGTHLYSKTPGRRARTASQVKEEALAKLRAEREKRKQEADERRRSLSVGSLSTEMTGARGKRSLGSAGKAGSAIPTPDGRQGQQDTPSSEQPKQAGQEQATAGEQPGNSAAGAPAGPSPPPGIDPSTAAFFYAMEGRLKSAAKETAGEITNLFQRNIERIDSNTKAITELRQNDKQLEKKMVEALGQSEARAEVRERQMEKRITDALTKKVDEAVSATNISARSAVASASAQPLSRSQQERREMAYHLCRRSLKAWPVDGPDLVDSFRVFMANKLKISDATIEAMGPITVTRRPGKVAEQKLEVLVTFDTKEDRDLVKAAGPSLAGMDNVGLLIHVPGHLLDNLNALNNVGYNIKMNNAGVRRSVKFDDENLDIFMDIKIRDQWRRITPSEARQVASTMPRSAGGRGSKNLSVEDISALVQGDAVVGLNVEEVPPDQD